MWYFLTTYAADIQPVVNWENDVRCISNDCLLKRAHLSLTGKIGTDVITMRAPANDYQKRKQLPKMWSTRFLFLFVCVGVRACACVHVCACVCVSVNTDNADGKASI